MRVHSVAFMVVVAAYGTLPLSAHHSVQGTYDTTKPVTLSGVIGEVKFRNPHATLMLTGKDANGQARTWTIEMAGPNALIKRNIDIKSFAVGTPVTVEVWFPKAGGDSLVSGHTLTTSDGKTIDITDNWAMIFPNGPAGTPR